MNSYYTLLSFLGVLSFIVPTLFQIAFITLAERTTMGSAQRRIGPNIVGFWGSLQAFADALKLLLKEYVLPAIANPYVFMLGPIINLVFALLGFLVIPLGYSVFLSDMRLGIFFLIAVSSLGTYGIMLSGWASNSKYAFLGGLRSTAQLISYELVLSSALLIVVFLTSSLNLMSSIEAQRGVWFLFPLFPIFLLFFIGAVAETNRAPFDLAEAESELVAGYMTEYASVVFVFFFLAEYGAILLMCIQTSIFFFGGYLSPRFLLFPVWLVTLLGLEETSSFILDGFIGGCVLGVKTIGFVFIFIIVRASLPRIRFDQLMGLCWVELLPMLFALIIAVPSSLAAFDALLSSVPLL